MQKSSRNFQKLLFELIEKKCPKNENHVHAIADVLNISKDVAYRRHRLESSMDIDEAMLLMCHFKIEPHALLPINNGHRSLIFNHLQFGGGENDPADINHYLNETEAWLKKLQARKGTLYYMAKDLPVFSLFQYPTLGHFKLFTWLKTVKNLPQFKENKFSTDIIPEAIYNRCAEISALYHHLPSREMWTTETINSFLMQVRYYQRTNVFKDANILKTIKEELLMLINQYKNQCENGFKTYNGQDLKDVSFELYRNEILIMDNVILGQAFDYNFTLLSLNGMEYIHSTDDIFNNGIVNYFTTNCRKCKPIHSHEMDRNDFFNEMEKMITAL